MKKEQLNELRMIVMLIKFQHNDNLEPFKHRNNIDDFVNKHKDTFHGYFENKELYLNELYNHFNGPSEPKVISIHDPGWVKNSINQNLYDESFWKRYQEYLIGDDPSFPTPSLNKSTSKILNYLEDPNKKGAWCRKGMVVGHVQSGKTANYIGVINKALGHGYKLIIVLTGMLDSLRIQTQERIDYGVIGQMSAASADFKRGDSVGVGIIEQIVPQRKIISFTSINPSKEGGDFKSNKAPNMSNSLNDNDAYILTVKKNKSPLGEIITWLNSLKGDKKELVKNIPTLILDDEADSASVNTGKEGEDPKTINRYIRIILNMLEKVCYLGYTATPYANIFIEASDEEKTTRISNEDYDISKDLFPSDFIINLQAPSNYFSPEKIFLDENGNRLLKILEDYNDNYRSVFPSSIKTETPLPEELNESIKDSIRHYLIVSIIREFRDGYKSHNSMLIHVSLRVIWIDRVSNLVDEYLQELQTKIISNDKKVINSFKDLYNDIIYNSKKTKQLFDIDLSSFRSFEEVLSVLVKTIKYVDVVAVHGGGRNHYLEHEMTSFEYGEYPRYFICVGGNILSRGITLKGLTTSYFIRVSKMYDSLMQMGRWFGYRKNYSDLCRLYTSSELANWYSFITEATIELRKEFDNLNIKTTPKSYSLRVRESSDILKITSLGKMRYTKKIKTSYDGKTPTLREFEARKQIHKNNLERVLDSLKRLENNHSNDINTSKFWKGEKTDLIIDILKSFEVHPMESSTHNLLIKFISENKNIYNEKWNIILVNNSIKDLNYIEFKGSNIYCVKRKNQPGYYSSDTFKVSGQSTTSSSDRILDLRIIENNKKLTIEQCAQLRDKLNVPLLLIYLIDGHKSCVERDEGEIKKNPIYSSELSQKGVIVPTYFIQFPNDIIGRVKKVDYVVNLIEELNETQEEDE